MRIFIISLWSFVSTVSPASETDPQCIIKYLLRAEAAGLHYHAAGGPGIARVLKGDEFVYFGPDGQAIADPETIGRIHRLDLPPGYHDVWISTDPDAHIQATGIDARGRTQYRYHPAWIEASSIAKFERMRMFGEALPGIRSKMSAALAQQGLPKEKTLAALVRLLDRTMIRVGNEEYAVENESYGLTTLLKSQVSVSGAKITFDFMGKSHVHHALTVEDPTVASLIQELKSLPGDSLFRYRDKGGSIHAIESNDVNHYLGAISGGAFTAKDFRTWGGTTAAVESLLAAGAPGSPEEAERAIKIAAAFAAERLGNTPEVCLKNYIDPRVLDAYRAGRLKPDAIVAQGTSWLSQAEGVTLQIVSP